MSTTGVVAAMSTWKWPKGGVPGANDGRGGGGAQDVLHGAQQMFTDDRVVLGCHVQAAMLMHDARHRSLQRTQVVDVGGIGVHGVRECAMLLSRLLVAHVEHVLQRGMRGEDALVEPCHDAQAVARQHGDGGFDDLDGRVDRHVQLLVSMLGGSASPYSQVPPWRSVGTCVAGSKSWIQPR
jgi:hypothetical protein